MPNYTHASDTGVRTLTGSATTLVASRLLNGASGVYVITMRHPKTISVPWDEHSRFASTYLTHFGYHRALTSTVGLHPGDGKVWGVGGLISDILNLHTAHTYPFKYHEDVIDFMQVHERLLTAFLASLTEHVGLHETSHQARALFILDALSITPSTITQMVYNLSILQLVRVRSGLNKFLGGAITEQIGMTSALIPRFVGNPVLGDGLGLHDILGRSLLFRVVLDEEVAFHDTNILRQILHGTLSDGVQLSAAYVSPGGTFTTWAVNTRTGFTTEYTNWQFNSFTEINNKYIGANDTGLYELNGPDDAGTSVIADIKSGWMQIGGSKFTSFKAAYLGVRGSSVTLPDAEAGKFFLKLETGDGRFFTYEIDARNMKTTKVNLGKGLRARYFSYQLTSTGQDFDLDSVEFLPIVEQRRV